MKKIKKQKKIKTIHLNQYQKGSGNLIYQEYLSETHLLIYFKN